MPKVHYVTREQIMAAKLAVKIATEYGFEIDPITVKIANAESPHRKMSADDEFVEKDDTQSD